MRVRTPRNGYRLEELRFADPFSGIGTLEENGVGNRRYLSYSIKRTIRKGNGRRNNTHKDEWNMRCYCTRHGQTVRSKVNRMAWNHSQKTDIYQTLIDSNDSKNGKALYRKECRTTLQSRRKHPYKKHLSHARDSARTPTSSLSLASTMISFELTASPLSSSRDLPMVSGIIKVVKRPRKLIAAKIPRAPWTPRPLGKHPVST